MTPVAGQPLMFTVERKPRFIMVKFRCGTKSHVGMTTRTFSDPADLKLPVMNILMASGTTTGQPGKGLSEFTLRLFFEMAIAAVPAGMGARESESRQVMIKPHQIPALLIVTLFAGFLRIMFLTDGWIMNIFMTIGTAKANLTEIPFFALLMTGKTGGSQVSAFQRKCRTVMLLKGVVRR